jgi:hypothetical protein
MTGFGWQLFSPGFSLLFVVLLSIVYFGYVWLQTHGVVHTRQFHNPHVDAMAGDEGSE